MSSLVASERNVYERAHQFLAGCGWFALIVGGGLGLVFGLYAHQQSGLLDPSYLKEIFSHVLLGRLPTVLVAAFVLLRVNFQMATDHTFEHVWTQTRHSLTYVVACGVTCMLAWMWFFLAVLIGSWLGMMQSHAGFGQGVWEAYWGEFEFQYWLHAGLRMLLLAAALSGLTYFEIKLLKSHQNWDSHMMSRSMTVGMVIIVGIEVLDLLWQLHA